MKKTNFLKIALTLVMAFVISGAFAQILTDYDETNAVDMYQTENTTFRLYAMPDANFSPSYDATTNTNIDANARWTWDLGSLTAIAPWVDNTTPIAQNYVEITAPASGGGPYTIDATESNTLGGGCASSNTESQVVNVVAEPDAAFTTADILTPAGCGDQVAESITIEFTETGVPASLAGYAFAVSEVVENIDGLGATTSTESTTLNFVDFPTTGKAQDGTAGFTAGSPSTYVFNSSALVVLNNARTKYIYTLLEPTDLSTGSNGVVSAISEKSQYLDGVTTFAYSDEEVVFIVNPAPVTGPIYHISNDANL